MLPPLRPSKQQSSKAFTLVEMLVVMGVISVLLALGVSSVSLVSNEAVNSAGNQLVDAVTLARQNSISRDAYTAVVIKTGSTGAYTAYCVIAMVRTDDGSYSTTWQTLSPWKYLPTGTVFSAQTYASAQNVVPTPGTNAQATTPTGLSLPTNYGFQGKQIDLTKGATAVLFQPDGTLSTGQTELLSIVEGAVNTAASTPVITYKHLNAQGNSSNYYNVLILRDTGQAKVDRL